MAVITIPGMFLTGTHAARPAAADVGIGSLYACSDHTLVYQSDGSSWTTWFDPTGGAGGTGQGLVDYEFAKRVSGDITLNSTSWANVDTGLDLVLDAATGDTILAGASMVIGSEATTLCLDVATIVSAAPVNYFGTAGGAGDFGITSWLGTTGQVESAGAPTMYTLQSGDISTGTVTLRLRYRTTSATNKTLRASSTLPFLWWAENIGPAM